MLSVGHTLFMLIFEGLFTYNELNISLFFIFAMSHFIVMFATFVSFLCRQLFVCVPPTTTKIKHRQRKMYGKTQIVT